MAEFVHTLVKVYKPHTTVKRKAIINKRIIYYLKCLVLGGQQQALVCTGKHENVKGVSPEFSAVFRSDGPARLQGNRNETIKHQYKKENGKKK